MMVEIDVNNCEKEEALIMKFVQLIADTEIKSTRKNIQRFCKPKV